MPMITHEDWQKAVDTYHWVKNARFALPWRERNGSLVRHAFNVANGQEGAVLAKIDSPLGQGFVWQYGCPVDEAFAVGTEGIPVYGITDAEAMLDRCGYIVMSAPLVPPAPAEAATPRSAPEEAQAPSGEPEDTGANAGDDESDEDAADEEDHGDGESDDTEDKPAPPPKRRR